MLDRSSLRRASEGRNLRADDRARIALAAKGFAPNGLRIVEDPDAFDEDGEPCIMDRPDFALLNSTRAENDATMPDIDPTDLIGRTYLKFTGDDNGERERAKILEVLKPDPGDSHLSHPLVLKLRCKVNNGEKAYEEIVAYNDIMHLLEKESMEPGKWNFERLLAHKGPLKKGQKGWNHSSYNVQVAGPDGSIT